MPEQDTEANLSRIPHVPEVDRFLQEIARLANVGVSQGIVLFVGGTVISGQTTSGTNYFKQVSEQVGRTTISGGGGPEIAKLLQENYQSFGAVYERPDDAADDWEQPTPVYLHLEDARVFTAKSSFPGDKGFLWRGRLSSIDAFSLTRLSTN